MVAVFIALGVFMGVNVLIWSCGTSAMPHGKYLHKDSPVTEREGN